MGQVSVARDEKLNRQVALKEIRTDKRDRAELHERFLAEAEITGQLEHPGIVPIHDLEEDSNGQVRYAMRFIQGRTLREAIANYHQHPSPLAFLGLVEQLHCCSARHLRSGMRTVDRRSKWRGADLGWTGRDDPSA